MLGVLLIAADLAGTLAVEDRTEARVRAPGTDTAAASFDLETTPALRLSLASRRTRFTLSYAPRLTLWDVGTPDLRPTLLNAGAARLEWQGARTLLSIQQSGSYGGVSFASVPLSPGENGALPRPQVIPTRQLIQFASSTTTLASRLTLRRWTLDMTIGYELSGGAGAASRAFLPFQGGPGGRMTAGYDASRRDRLETSVSGSEASFSTGAQSVVVQVDEVYRHLLSRLTEARLSIGVSEARTRTSPTAAYAFGTYPVAEAVIDHHPNHDGHTDVRVGVKLGPVVNRLIGLVDQRVEGSLVLTHRHRRLDTHVFASGSQSIPANDVNATSLVSGELGAAYRVTRLVVFDAGLRGMWQRQTIAQVGFLQGTLFFGVTLRAPPTRL